MALMKERQLTQKYKELAKDNEELSRDIDQLEELLASHAPNRKLTSHSDGQKQTKENGKFMWKHGQKGSLHMYKGSEKTYFTVNPEAMSNINRSATATKVRKSEKDTTVTKSSKSVTDKVDLQTDTQVEVKQKSKSSSAVVAASTHDIDDTRLEIARGARKVTERSAKLPAERFLSRSEKEFEKTKVEHATKSKTLQSLIKKAGVEEKLKDFKIPEKQPELAKIKDTDSTLRKTSVQKEPVTRKSLRTEPPSVKLKELPDEDPEKRKFCAKVQNQQTAERRDGSKSLSNGTRQRKTVPGGNQHRAGKEPVKKVCDAEVLSWLETLKMKDIQKYAAVFAEHEVDMHNVMLLGRSDLREMGISALGPLNSLCSAIEVLHKDKARETKRQDSLKKRSKVQINKEKAAEFVPDQEPAKSEKQNNEEISSPAAKKTEDASKMNRRSQAAARRNRPASAPGLRKPTGNNLPKTGQVPKTEDTKRIEVKFSMPEAVEKEISVVNKRQTKKLPSRRPVSALPPKQDSTVIDPKILKRPPSARQSMAMSVAHIAMPNEHSDGDIPVTRPAALPFSGRKSNTGNKSELDSLVQEMTHQIEVLQQRSDSDSATRQLVEMLQGQIQEIQQQILTIGVEAPVTRPSSGPRPRTANLLGKGIVSPALQGNMRPQKTRTLEGEEVTDESGGMTKPLNTAMTKQAILKEVRKQKDDYRKQIRHLESELNRIKHQDPLKTCEIPESEVLFSKADLIGEGAFACVYRGQFQGSYVAVKQLKIPLSSQDKNYFAAEVQLLRELRHPRVVLLIGVCTGGHLPLMVLEYMDGGSLYAYLHNPQVSALDHAAYFQISRDIALGMNYLHLHKPTVLHLDLKSMNVLLNQHLRGKIADFGFSKLKHQHRRKYFTGHEAEMANQSKVKEGVKGTPAWMAPELIDAKDITTKADVYSFAVVLWEMLTRKQPYQGCSTFQVLERIRNNKRLEIPDQCPVGLANLIKKCWDQNPGRRPHFKDVLAQLEELHFPAEWRELFKVAGVPPAALEDVQSTRTLINIVNHTVGDSGPEGAAPVCDFGTTDAMSGTLEAIDKLDLNFLEPEATFRKVDGHTLRASQAWSEINVYSEQVPDGNKNSSNPYDFRINVDSTEICAPSGAPPPPPPPAPAPPPVPSIATSALSSAASHGESVGYPHSLGEAQAAAGGHVDSQDLLSQKAKLKPHAERQFNMKPEALATDTGLFRVASSELQKQKDLLKSTSVPHPNQLTDLGAVHPNRLSGLADILKKAVSDRRVVIETKESVDASISGSSWSYYED